MKRSVTLNFLNIYFSPAPILQDTENQVKNPYHAIVTFPKEDKDTKVEQINEVLAHVRCEDWLSKNRVV